MAITPRHLPQLAPCPKDVDTDSQVDHQGAEDADPDDHVIRVNAKGVPVVADPTPKLMIRK